jgi:hypothetical protein
VQVMEKQARPLRLSSFLLLQLVARCLGLSSGGKANCCPNFAAKLRRHQLAPKQPEPFQSESGRSNTLAAASRKGLRQVSPTAIPFVLCSYSETDGLLGGKLRLVVRRISAKRNRLAQINWPGGIRGITKSSVKSLWLDVS